jgi:hypothetical protein
MEYVKYEDLTEFFKWESLLERLLFGNEDHNNAQKDDDFIINTN